jgi:type III secretory pathway component EscU
MAVNATISAIEPVAGFVRGVFGMVQLFVGGIFGLYVILVILKWFEYKKMVKLLKEIKTEIRKLGK